MKFSERFPDAFRAVEENLRKQAEDRGLDYDTIKAETESGIVFGSTYYGELRFGQKYALKMKPGESELIDYKDVFWAFGAKGGSQEEYDCIVIVFLDGHDTTILLNDKEDEQVILDLIHKASPEALIGRTEENRKKYKTLTEKTKKKEEPPKTPEVPAPVAKLPQSTVDSMHQKIEYMISLSKKLAETDQKCYVKYGEPADDDGMKAISEWCNENGVSLPEPYLILLSHANGFLVDFNAAKVGYFNFKGFDTKKSPEEIYGRTKEELLARKYESYINCKVHFGALAYVGFHYNPYTGEMFFEKTGGFGWEEKFIPIKDFEKEVLDKVIEYLEKNERKGKVLKDAAKNPMKKYYDRLLAYMEERDDPDMAVYAPLTKKEITAWEKSHEIQLPRDYKNWLMLSDGGEFADKSICKLEELDPENPATDPVSGKGYITIANLSGFSDCLVFDPKTKEMFILTDDGKCRAGDFVFHVFQEGFKELDESEE